MSSTTSQNIVAPSPVLNFGNGASSGGKSKKKKGKITKSDISLPTNFEYKNLFYIFFIVIYYFILF